MKNTKIKYEAPIIFDLASRGRMQGVLTECQQGSVANDAACATGATPGPDNGDDCLVFGATAADLCAQGANAGAGVCFTGSSADGIPGN